MALLEKYGDWVSEITATTGTGTLTLGGASAGNKATVADVFDEGDTLYYHIYDQATDSQESGQGVFTLAGTTLTRVPNKTLVGSVYDDTSPSPISLSGDAVVFASITSETFEDVAADLATKLPVDGSVSMTGELILSGDAVSDLGAATKQQLDTTQGSVPVLNLLDNSNFSVWQRGTPITAIPNIQQVAADRWKLVASTGSALTYTAQPNLFAASDLPTKSKYTLRVGGTIAEVFYIQQHIEEIDRFSGSKVSMSFWMYTPNPLTIHHLLGFRFGDGGSANLELPSNDVVVPGAMWTEVTHTWDVPDLTAYSKGSGTRIFCYFRPVVLDGLSNTIVDLYFSGMQLVLGSRVPAYVPPLPAVEFDRCLRYYNKVNTSLRANVRNSNDAEVSVSVNYSFPTVMYQTPVVSNTVWSNSSAIASYGSDVIGDRSISFQADLVNNTSTVSVASFELDAET